MKRTKIYIIIILACVFIAGSVYASSYTEYYAVYNNEHISLKVRNRNITWVNKRKRRLSRRRSIVFELKAKPGYKILNNTTVMALGQTKKFNAKFINKYFKNGTTWVRGSLRRDNVFTITYFVCKAGGDTCIRVSQVLKFIFGPYVRRSHGKSRGRIVEIK